VIFTSCSRSPVSPDFWKQSMLKAATLRGLWTPVVSYFHKVVNNFSADYYRNSSWHRSTDLCHNLLHDRSDSAHVVQIGAVDTSVLDWLTDWVAGCLAGWLTVWLSDWLIDLWNVQADSCCVTGAVTLVPSTSAGSSCWAHWSFWRCGHLLGGVLRREEPSCSNVFAELLIFLMDLLLLCVATTSVVCQVKTLPLL